jgi:hypothetical protein
VKTNDYKQPSGFCRGFLNGQGGKLFAGDVAGKMLRLATLAAVRFRRPARSIKQIACTALTTNLSPGGGLRPIIVVATGDS